MRLLMKIIVVVLFYTSLLQADNQKVELNTYYDSSIEIIKDFGNHNYILCIEGYKWLKFNGFTPQQMFRESLNGRTVPLRCNI